MFQKVIQIRHKIGVFVPDMKKYKFRIKTINEIDKRDVQK